jgi:hypothetical protein
MSSVRGGTQNLCRRLRSKGMFVDAEPDPTVPNMSDGFFWCIQTMTCLGPDGKVAESESCRSGRRCYEPH